jgi:hypothetical protein
MTTPDIRQANGQLDRGQRMLETFFSFSARFAREGI